MVRRFIRNAAFDLARNDLAFLLEEHEDDLVMIFREEMVILDDRVPEEKLFIDIKMEPLGELILRASLRAIRRFLRQTTAEDLPD